VSEPCAACPVAGAALGVPCARHALNHPRYCELAARDPATWGPLIVRASRLAADSAGAAEEPAGPPARKPGDSEPPLPPLPTQAWNLVKAEVRHAADGRRTVDAATLAARLSHCNGCEKLRGSDRRCSACGCPVDVKATWASESCPLGKWSAAPNVGGGCSCRNQHSAASGRHSAG
jgi:hypothetical protein